MQSVLAARLYRYRFSQSPSLLVSGSGRRPQREELPLSHSRFATENIKNFLLALYALEKNFELGFWASLVQVEPSF